MLDNFIEVFKAGTHTDGFNNTKTWTEADLRQFANNHTHSKAPIVMGHPSDLDSADKYGISEEVKVEDGKLLVKFTNVDPTFSKIVSSGEIANRSIGARKGKNGWYLEHVGFLGSTPPALDDLAPIFNKAKEEDSEYCYYTFAFNANEISIKPWRYQSGIHSIKELFRGVRDWIIQENDIDTADTVLPSHRIDNLQDASSAITHKPTDTTIYQKGEELMSKETPVSNTDNSKTQEATFTQSQLDQAVQQAEAKFQKKLDERDKAQAAKEAKSTIAQFVRSGNVTPAQAEGMEEFMSTLGNTDTYSFTKGDDTKEESTALAWFTNFVSSLKSGVVQGEADLDDTQVAQFSAAQIAKYAKDNDCDPVTALDRLKEEGATHE